MDEPMFKTRVMEASEEAVRLGADLILSGELVAFPTETVYGLGGDATNPRSAAKIYAAKGRPLDNPLIVHVGSLEEARGVGVMTDLAERLCGEFWPGPLTVVVPAREVIPPEVRGGLDTVAVRCPSHPVALALISASGVPIAAPSANRSGRPSPTDAFSVLEDLGGLIPLILDGGPCGVGLESTVVDATSDVPVVLRHGGVTAQDLREAVGGVLAIGCLLYTS
ncbi:MAG: L-threonylcarbamoyladenylate synthase, partial [Thermanaerothrix sp.]|nr:L-threonylcarbamoyladenylate synthase [Thermanaerothrix sp.]